MSHSLGFSSPLAKVVSLCAIAALVTASPARAQFGATIPFGKGFYAQTDIGAYITAGGGDGYSNVQTFLQLGGGYSLRLAKGQFLVPVGISVGIGANAQNCWASRLASGACASADSFTLLQIEASGGFLVRLIPSVYLGPRVTVGTAVLVPRNQGSTDAAFSLGVGGSLDYLTGFSSLSVGIDVMYRRIFGADVNAISISPRVRYIF